MRTCRRCSTPRSPISLAADRGAAVDFYFGGDFSTSGPPTAHTLKARYYMHTAENSDLSYDNTKLEQRVDRDGAGHLEPDGDFSRRSTRRTTFEQNLFYRVPRRIAQAATSSRRRCTSIWRSSSTTGAAGAAVQQEQQRRLPRLACRRLGGQQRVDVRDRSRIQTGDRHAMPRIFCSTAEANYRLGNRRDRRSRICNLERTERTARPARQSIPGGTNGLLVGILEEKFVRLFLNPEVYFDYLRTCVPNISLPANHTGGFQYVPARLPYGYTEQTTNTANTPADPIANAEWPKHATGPAGVTCAGQVDRPGV